MCCVEQRVRDPVQALSLAAEDLRAVHHDIAVPHARVAVLLPAALSEQEAVMAGVHRSSALLCLWCVRHLCIHLHLSSIDDVFLSFYFCAAGIECIHHMLRYVHLGKGYRLLVFLMNVNCVMQLLCVGVVMGKSEDMVNLIGNFVGVAIVLQIDEFLAVYIRIKDINPQLLESKSWRKKMMLNSKMWVIAIAAAFVYVVTIVCWRVDSLYCASYNLEGNLNHVNAGTVDPSGTVRFRF